MHQQTSLELGGMLALTVVVVAMAGGRTDVECGTVAWSGS